MGVTSVYEAELYAGVNTNYYVIVDEDGERMTVGPASDEEAIMKMAAKETGFITASKDYLILRVEGLLVESYMANAEQYEIFEVDPESLYDLRNDIDANYTWFAIDPSGEGVFFRDEPKWEDSYWDGEEYHEIKGYSRMLSLEESSKSKWYLGQSQEDFKQIDSGVAEERSWTHE